MKPIDIFYYLGILYLVYCIIYQFIPNKIGDTQTNIDPLNLKNSMQGAIKDVTGGAGLSWHEKVMGALSTIWNVIGFFTNEYLFFVLLFLVTSILPVAQMLKPKQSSLTNIKLEVSKKVVILTAVFEMLIIICTLYHHYFVIKQQ